MTFDLKTVCEMLDKLEMFRERNRNFPTLSVEVLVDPAWKADDILETLKLVRDVSLLFPDVLNEIERLQKSAAGWEETARTYADNAVFWRNKAERLELELQSEGKL